MESLDGLALQFLSMFRYRAPHARGLRHNLVNTYRSTRLRVHFPIDNDDSVRTATSNNPGTIVTSIEKRKVVTLRTLSTPMKVLFLAGHKVVLGQAGGLVHDNPTRGGVAQ